MVANKLLGVEQRKSGRECRAGSTCNKFLQGTFITKGDLCWQTSDTF